MITVRGIYDYLNEIAPVDLRIGDDNVGLLVGRGSAPVTKVMVALDITPEVIGEAASWEAELIVSHHAVIPFRISGVTDRDYTGERVLMLIENGIAAICMHTNLDIAIGGVNDTLASRIGLTNIEVIPDPSLSPKGDRGVCRMGTLPEPMEIEAFALHVKRSLGGNGIKYLPAGREVRKVAVGGGSCGSDIHLVAAAGCDTFVTSDIKHAHMLEAGWLGINLLDAGHFPTEDVICGVLADSLRARFPGLEVRKSEKLTDPMKYIGDV